jgi:hypothetical protein
MWEVNISKDGLNEYGNFAGKDKSQKIVFGRSKYDNELGSKA